MGHRKWPAAVVVELDQRRFETGLRVSSGSGTGAGEAERRLQGTLSTAPTRVYF